MDCEYQSCCLFKLKRRWNVDLHPCCNQSASDELSVRKMCTAESAVSFSDRLSISVHCFSPPFFWHTFSVASISVLCKCDSPRMLQKFLLHGCVSCCFQRPLYGRLGLRTAVGCRPKSVTSPEPAQPFIPQILAPNLAIFAVQCTVSGGATKAEVTCDPCFRLQSTLEAAISCLFSTYRCAFWWGDICPFPYCVEWDVKPYSLTPDPPLVHSDGLLHLVPSFAGAGPKHSTTGPACVHLLTVVVINSSNRR